MLIHLYLFLNKALIITSVFTASLNYLSIKIEYYLFFKTLIKIFNQDTRPNPTNLDYLSVNYAQSSLILTKSSR